MPENVPATILCADDDAGQRQALGWLFRAAGLQVLEAGTGQEALRRLAERPDLVILDVNLPDMSGFEVCRQIKADPATRSIAVLQMSAVYVQSEDRAQGLEEGADAYLVKPVEPRELLATVRALLRVRQAENQVRAAAQEWRTTFDAISDAVCLVDGTGRILRCNRALTELLHRPFHHLVGRPYAGVVREGLGLTGTDAPDLEKADTRRDSRELLLGQRWFRATADPILDEHGVPAGAVHILTEITQRKELEEQLRQAQKLEAVGRLAGGVAHDFNNLLTAIVGNAALLQQRLTEQETDHQLAVTIEQAAWRAAELTRQLLGFSRQTLLWLRPTNLNDTVGETVALLERTIEARIHLELRRDPGLWPVQADPAQISQVVMNLCTNACEAMPQGGRLLLETGNRVVDDEHARSTLEARPGPFACLSVTDTGQGIPAELLPRIFDPFFTTKPPGQGTGLGLAMAFGIIKQHQGWIECHTEAGRGTRFEIYLPRLEAPAPQPCSGASPKVAPGAAETILLADDNDMLRTLAGALLRQNGFQVLLAEDGQEAVEVFQREHGRVDLVVLDLVMPRLSGQEALAQLRRLDPGVRVLFASGYTDTPLGEIEQAGVLGFVTKPYRQHDLIQAVREALDRPRDS